MAIPSQADFISLSEQILKLHRLDFGVKIYSESITDVEKIQALLTTSLEFSFSGAADLAKHPTMAWLIEQPAYKMARAKAFRTSKKGAETYQQWIAHSAHNIAEMMRDFEPEFALHRPINLLTPFGKEERRLAAAFGVPSNEKWNAAIMDALAEYHYTDNQKSIAVCQRDMPALMQQSTAALSALVESLRKDYEMHSDIFDVSSIWHLAERLLHSIQRRVPLGAEVIYPIKRNDRTAKERLFVYRMYYAHTSIFRAPRPDGIAMLLDLEGFEHPIDARNVEKLCAQFKVARRDYYKTVNAAHKAVTEALKQSN